MNVRLTHLDGSLPNLALMKLGAWHRDRGDACVLSRNVAPGLFEPQYDVVYASGIFTRSMPLVARFKAQWPDGIVGGTVLGGRDDWFPVERVLGVDEYERYDYSLYPEFEHSIGWTMRGCRLACKFCVVRPKEGAPRSVNSIADIWRGGDHAKHIILLDNDFFGQPPDQWEARVDELRRGNFKVNFNQGINVRLLRNPEHAAALASLRYYDERFIKRRIHTAFDNQKDEPIFRRGIELMLDAGINPDHIMAYMLVGFDQRETWTAIMDRFNLMLAYGIRPFPMVYESWGDSPPSNALSYRTLKDFQRWVVRRYYELFPFEVYGRMSEVERATVSHQMRLAI